MVAAGFCLLAYLLISAVVAGAWMRTDLGLLPPGRLVKGFTSVLVGWPVFLAVGAAVTIVRAARKEEGRFQRCGEMVAGLPATPKAVGGFAVGQSMGAARSHRGGSPN